MSVFSKMVDAMVHSSSMRQWDLAKKIGELFYNLGARVEKLEKPKRKFSSRFASRNIGKRKRELHLVQNEETKKSYLTSRF
jgi:hypothetical protein